jgi:hypothetical protein
MVGKILQTCEKNYIRAGKKITPAAVLEASKEYFEDRKNYFLKTNQFSIRESDLPFRSPVEVLNQLELLDKIVQKQKENQTTIGSTKYASLGKSPPVSHFHVTREYEKYIDFLQVNYFVNKVGELSVKTEKDVASVYAINLGLCESERINYWEPLPREYRDYLKERFFHFDKLLEEYFSRTNKIICQKCEHVFPFSDHDTFVKFKWNCPECSGFHTCTVIEEVLDKSKLLSGIDQSKLPEVEIKILGAISEYERSSLPTFPKEIAAEVDCSYQMVSKRMEKLKNLPYQLVVLENERDGSGRTRTVYRLTEKARGTYF